MPNYPILETFGVEVETINIKRERENDRVRNRIKEYVREVGDASIESPVFNFGNGIIVSKKDIEKIIPSSRFLGRDSQNIGRWETLGSEIITEPINFSCMEQVIFTLTKNLDSLGEPQRDTRAGIHVHIGYSYNLKILQKIIESSLWLESLIFHLGGMGYEFRGKTNNSAYCRPFSKSGPPVVESNYGLVKLFSPKDLYTAKDSYSFFNRFGGINLTNPPGRYYPARYMFVNLFSLLLHGTLEIRIFNKTLNPFYIMAAVEFSKQFAKYCMFYQLEDLEENSVFEFHTKEFHHNLLEKFASKVGFDPKYLEILHEILEATPVTILKDKLALTHCRNYGRVEYRIEEGFSPEIIKPGEEIEEPDIVDIHVLNGERNLRNSLRPQRIDRISATEYVITQETSDSATTFSEEAQLEEDEDEEEENENN